jgi:response regulator of citrate/malate metabolism
MTQSEVLNGTNQFSLVLVEDDAEIGSWINEKLKQLDNVAPFHWATSVSETMEILQDHIPDVIILDLKLPDGNGIEILRNIRQKGLKVKVIVFSINTGMKNVCLRMGAHAFYDKGSGSEDLIRDLENGSF